MNNLKIIKTRRKSLFQTIAEMIGKVSPVNNWLRKNSLIWELYSASPTVDYSKTNYFLTKAIFYASEVTDNQTGKKYGGEFLFGAVFGKPIVNSAAAFAFAKPPIVRIEEPGEKITEGVNEQTAEVEQENQSNDIDYTQSFIDNWEEKNEAELFKVARNALRDGDQYLLVKDDLSVSLISPNQVEIVDDKITGEILGYDVETYVEEVGDDGKNNTVKYLAKYRKEKPFYTLLRFETKSSKEGEIIEEDFGEDDEETRPLPIVGFHNERDANERYGNSEYQNCYYLMANYHAVLENAIKNNIYNSTATPVITGVDDMQKWLETNGTRNENGEYEIRWDANKLLVGGKDFDVKVVGGIQNAQDADRLLNILFWLICQASETPEFVMGTAVQSSKASVSEQMPVAIRKAERKRKEFKNFYRDLFKLVFYLGNKVDPQVLPNPKFSVVWPDILDKDLKLNIDIVKTLSEEGCITDKTKMILLGMDKWVDDLDAEIEEARNENEEKAQSQAAYGPNSLLAQMSQGVETGEELTPEERAIAEKVV